MLRVMFLFTSVFISSGLTIGKVCIRCPRNEHWKSIDFSHSSQTSFLNLLKLLNNNEALSQKKLIQKPLKKY
uniref:Secreted protein n=1 Tax=Lepeophtheirus salmonis TaxID=72036 RepID=A0A0K2U1X4_LEPSM